MRKTIFSWPSSSRPPFAFRRLQPFPTLRPFIDGSTSRALFMSPGILPKERWRLPRPSSGKRKTRGRGQDPPGKEGIPHPSRRGHHLHDAHVPLVPQGEGLVSGQENPL